MTYDESYAPYGIQPGAYIIRTTCPLHSISARRRRRTCDILDRWARCTNEAVYNRRGPYAGYGDQGVLNSVIFARRGGRRGPA